MVEVYFLKVNTSYTLLFGEGAYFGSDICSVHFASAVYTCHEKHWLSHLIICTCSLMCERWLMYFSFFLFVHKLQPTFVTCTARKGVIYTLFYSSAYRYFFCVRLESFFLVVVSYLFYHNMCKKRPKEKTSNAKNAEKR
jgi:hypothetical protein